MESENPKSFHDGLQSCENPKSFYDGLELPEWDGEFEVQKLLAPNHPSGENLNMECKNKC